MNNNKFSVQKSNHLVNVSLIASIKEIRILMVIRTSKSNREFCVAISLL